MSLPLPPAVSPTLALLPPFPFTRLLAPLHSGQAAPATGPVAAPAEPGEPAAWPQPRAMQPHAAGPAGAGPAARTGSAEAGRSRRRLWQLDGHAHCPVVGVCLPMPALRRLVARLAPDWSGDDDHTVHTRVVSACKRRGPIAEAVEAALDERFARPLAEAALQRSPDALAAWWADASTGHTLAGALWAVLTHPLCDVLLTDRVLNEVHMLQHQAGMARRVELQRFEALIDENAVLARELAQAQARSMRQAAEHARRADGLQAELLRLRAECVGRESALAFERERLAELEAAAPDLPGRNELARDNRALAEQVQTLSRRLRAAEDEARRQQSRADALLRTLELQTALAAQARVPGANNANNASNASTASTASTANTANTDTVGTGAADGPVAPAPGAGRTATEQSTGGPAAAPSGTAAARAVLCVGGRTAGVPAYRRLVEEVGGRFLHHDGGEEDNLARLDATLAAADLVICQTGCISHGAYWKVKDHCKRTGKRCLFVETPSRSALARALEDALAGPRRTTSQGTA